METLTITTRQRKNGVPQKHIAIEQHDNSVELQSDDLTTSPDDSETTSPHSPKRLILRDEFARKQIYEECRFADDDFIIEVETETPDGLTKRISHSIFSEDAAGNLIMTPYNLNRTLWQKDLPKSKSKFGSGIQQVTYHITRLKEPKTNQGKYKFPASETFDDSMPLIPPHLLEKFERKEKVKNLVLIEGYKKAICGSVHARLDIIGLPSITLITEKEGERVGQLYSAITDIIKTCRVENVVILWDADAPFCSESDIESGSDATRRPRIFAAQARKIREKLKDYSVDVFFAFGANHQNGKGLDDLISFCFSHQVDPLSISEDLVKFDGMPVHFKRANITVNNVDVIKLLGLNDVQAFYQNNTARIGKEKFCFGKKLFQSNGKEVSEVSEYNEAEYDFYTVEKKWDSTSSSMKIIKVTIKPTRFLACLNRLGFWRLDAKNTSQFVRISDNIVEEASPMKIADAFLSHLEKLPQLLNDNLPTEMLVDKFLFGKSTFFSDGMLQSLPKIDSEDRFNCDTKDTAFFYYKNGFVAVTKSKIVLNKYTELKKFIWKTQILSREFNLIKDIELAEKPFAWIKFIELIAGKTDEKRVHQLQRIIGYCLHKFFDTKLKAIILTDCRDDSDNAAGRSGKTLLCRGIGKILNPVEADKNFVEVNGKEFDSQDRFHWSKLSTKTTLVHLNDLNRRFSLEDRYADITEGLEVQRKNEHSFIIAAKMIFSANKPIKSSGSSTKDRVIEFEMTDFFSDKWSPEQQFEHWFFRDWNINDWQKFDYFMSLCVQRYFLHGLPKKPISINIENRKLIDQTNRDFILFMSETVVENTTWLKKKLFAQFKTDYLDFEKLTTQKFSQWLGKWAELNNEYSIEEKRNRQEKDFEIIFTKILKNE